MDIQEYHNDLPPPDILFGVQFSLEKAYLFFYNSTHRFINVYWLTPKGVEQFYVLLPPGKEVKVNTYINHCWLFRVKETGEKMHVMDKSVFLTKSYRVVDPNDESKWCPVRKRIIIHVPKRSLRDLCLWICAESMFNLCIRPSLLKLLLPQTIREDLSKILDSIDIHSKKELTRRIRRNN